VRISLPRAQRKLPTFFAVDEVMAVLATARADVDANRPDARLVWALISLLYGAGLRVGEACRLRWVDLSGEELRVLGKGHRERVVIVPPSIAEIVRSLPRNGLFIFGERPLPTTQAYRWVRRLGARAGLSRRLHPHALRHSLATHLLQGRMDLRILQDLLGHRSLATTERYVHLQVQDLARTMDSLHPLGRRTKTSTCES
jgi:integrase/recombinase XerC/integrase/recombinase XerD